MKRLNKTHIFHIFFGLLMFLPFISILSRVIYVQSNKNAKDSYSGNYEITYKYESNQVNSVNDLIEGNIYELECDNALISEIVNENHVMNFRLITSLQFDSEHLPLIDEALDSSINELSNNYILSFAHTSEFLYVYIYSSMYDFINSDYYLSLEYSSVFVNNPIIQLIDDSFQYTNDYEYFKYTDYNEIESVNLTGTLDNAFDYSISKFIEDNNFKINFFSWFEDLFLVQNGGVNALYLSFANWYMCYALLVSTGYLLFLILMWFINYVRKILEGGNSFGHGGF